jgi:hypothetical protein
VVEVSALMIEIGFIANGPGLMRRPIVRDIRHLRTSLARAGSIPRIELVYFIPGRLGKPDFDRFEMGWSQANNCPIVFIHVPAEVAKALEPMADIVQLGRHAIEFAQANAASQRGQPIDFDAVFGALEQALRHSGVGSGVEGAREPSPRTAAGHGPASADQALEIDLSVDDAAQLEEAFQLERLLDERLRGSGLGYVDGNEIGQAEFTILLYGPDIEALRGTVEPIVREKWVARAFSVRAP